MCSIVKKHNLLCEKISLVCKFCPPPTSPFSAPAEGGLPSFNKGGLLKLVLHQEAENAAFNSPKHRHNYIWNRWKGPWTVIVTWIANARFIKPKRYCMLLLRCCSQHNGKCFFLHWPACKGIKRHKKNQTRLGQMMKPCVCCPEEQIAFFIVLYFQNVFSGIIFEKDKHDGLFWPVHAFCCCTFSEPLPTCILLRNACCSCAFQAYDKYECARCQCACSPSTASLAVFTPGGCGGENNRMKNRNPLNPSVQHYFFPQGKEASLQKSGCDISCLIQFLHSELCKCMSQMQLLVIRHWGQKWVVLRGNIFSIADAQKKKRQITPRISWNLIKSWMTLNVWELR